MESQLPVTLIELTRQERLELWMKRSGWTYVSLGALVGITGVSAKRHLHNDTIPTCRYAVWGKTVPVDLLPRAADLRPGRKPLPVVAARMA